MKQAAKGRRSQDADIDTVAELITSMSRILHALSEHRALKDQNVGFAEWVMLRCISQNSGMRAPRLARRLGISPQRANQVIGELRTAGYVEVVRSSEDTRARDIAITAPGRAKLAVADREILDIFMKPFETRPRVVANLRGPVQRLANALSTSATTLRKGGKAAKLEPTLNS